MDECDKDEQRRSGRERTWEDQMLKMIAGKVLGRLWEHTARKEGQELYAETIRECRQKNAGLLFDLHMRRSCIPQDCGRDAV